MELGNINFKKVVRHLLQDILCHMDEKGASGFFDESIISKAINNLRHGLTN